MKPSRLIVNIVALLGMTVAAHAGTLASEAFSGAIGASAQMSYAVSHAGTLASGALSGGGTQTAAVCNVRNVGTSPISALDVAIFTQTGVKVPTTGTCSGTLDPQEACSINAAIATSLTHGCTATFVGNEKNLRGTFDVRAGNTVLQAESLR